MPKKIVLIGPDGSGRSLFNIAMAIALERKGYGLIKPLHPLYGRVIDAALARNPHGIPQLFEDYIGEIRYKGKKIRLIEPKFTDRDFSYNTNIVANSIVKAHHAIVFPKTVGTKTPAPAKKGLRPAGGKVKESSDLISVKVFSFLRATLLKAFKKWRLFRTVKHVFFIVPNGANAGLTEASFEEQFTAANPVVMQSMQKRKVKVSFHLPELIYPDGGVNPHSLDGLLEKVLNLYS